MSIYAIDVALSQLGVHEKTNKNDGIPAERYMKGDALAWCAGFALFCNETSDDPNIARTLVEHYRMRRVSVFMRVARERRMWVEQGHPVANDFVFFDLLSDVDIEGSHMGIVEHVDLKTKRVHTIEGNTSNKVARRDYRLDARAILGYARVRVPQWNDRAPV